MFIEQPNDQDVNTDILGIFNVISIYVVENKEKIMIYIRFKEQFRQKFGNKAMEFTDIMKLIGLFPLEKSFESYVGKSESDSIVFLFTKIY